jgi:adenylate cyclase
MTRAVETASAVLPAPDPKLLAHRVALDAWRRDLLTIYLSLVIGALVAGQLRNRVERRSLHKTSFDT